MSQPVSLPNNAYLRALRGAVPIPATGREKLAFQALMVFCMVVCMVTLNWLLHTPDLSPNGFSQALYEYPLTFIIAFVVRTLIANPLVEHIVRAVVPTTLAGLKRTVALTLINVGIMVTIMTFFGVIISNGPAQFSWLGYAQSLPFSFVMAFGLNFLVVGPAVKLIFAHIVKPKLMLLLQAAHKLRATVQSLTLTGTDKDE